MSMTKKKFKCPVYFLIGAGIGVLLFLLIYGVKVLDFTYDEWLLTGKDLQQHYLGWKFFRKAPWTFPIGLHDYFTSPDAISVLYTDSIPLFAIFFKLLSPILPETFQYFGLFGVMCYVLNGGMAAVIVSKFNKSKLVCGFSSMFFILSTPVLQRLFGVLTENSRHTSLAAHFLILGALAVWIFKDKFISYKKDALVWAVLAALCVLIQMYIIFMVGGIMCGYLLEQLLSKKDWKRLLVDFGSFVLSFGICFVTVGGINSILASGGSGYGFFSANLNTLINPWKYSTFFDEMGTAELQYEGFAYLGLGMIVLTAIAACCLLVKGIKLGKQRRLGTMIRETMKKHYPFLISLFIVVFVFSVLAFSNLVYLGSNIFIEVHWPKFIDDLLAIIRSSGRFIWCVMYIVMIGTLFIVSKNFKGIPQKIIIIVCVCLQLADLYAPIQRLQNQYQGEVKVEDSLVQSDFWNTKLGDFSKVVYYPSDGYDATQMLQIGAKVSQFEDLKMSNFYLSRYMTKETVKQKDKITMELFKKGELAEDTLYIIDYAKAHKYRDICNVYIVDDKIIAVKNPIEGLEPYKDFMLSEENSTVEFNLAYGRLGQKFMHRGWHSPEFGDEGGLTTNQSVVRLYSEEKCKAKITIECEPGETKGKTNVKMNGRRIGIIDNKFSGTVTFETTLKECKNIRNSKYINWLFFECDKVKEPKKAGEEYGVGLVIKKITVTYSDEVAKEK